jgi:arylsulfatase A-like enzyme
MLLLVVPIFFDLRFLILMKYLLSLFVFCASLPSSIIRAESTKAPNIVVFFVDDMGWAQPSCYGGKLAETPHMDDLAKNGVRFTNGYSSACICSPGRVGLMTGRYQSRTGHDANATRAGRELLLSETTMGQYLQSAGYETGIVGKWHLGDTSAEFLPPARGFDFAVGSVGNLGEGTGPSFYAGAELKEEMAGAPITSPVYAGEACKFIEQKRDKPFFLYLSFNAVHTPIVASPAWLEKYKDLEPREQAYAALVGEADEAIGTVMTKLRELNLEEDTLVYCISDNGGASPIAEQMGLRGRKWFVWEGGIRVSYLVQWKGTIPGGRVVADPVIQLDVLPTSLAAAGAKAPDVEIDGVNLLPMLTGKEPSLSERALYFRFGVQHAVRQGDWKLVKASLEMEPMLVNLTSDPGESKDLSESHPDKKAELQKLWESWDATMQPPRWEDLRWNGDEDRKVRSNRNNREKPKKQRK